MTIQVSTASLKKMLRDVVAGYSSVFCVNTDGSDIIANAAKTELLKSLRHHRYQNVLCSVHLDAGTVFLDADGEEGDDFFNALEECQNELNQLADDKDFKLEWV